MFISAAFNVETHVQGAAQCLLYHLDYNLSSCIISIQHFKDVMFLKFRDSTSDGPRQLET